MTQEKVCGALKLETDADQNNHTDVPYQSDHVNHQKLHNKETLKLMTTGQAQKNKFCHICELWLCLHLDPVCIAYGQIKRNKWIYFNLKNLSLVYQYSSSNNIKINVDFAQNLI